jgi:hypothetical protein
MGEALTWHIYLALLVARLVAMQVISWQEKSAHSAQETAQQQEKKCSRRVLPQY